MAAGRILIDKLAEEREIRMETEEDKKAGLDRLENTDIALNNLEEKERLSVAMSSYYILYR